MSAMTISYARAALLTVKDGDPTNDVEGGEKAEEIARRVRQLAALYRAVILRCVSRKVDIVEVEDNIEQDIMLGKVYGDIELENELDIADGGASQMDHFVFGYIPEEDNTKTEIKATTINTLKDLVKRCSEAVRTNPPQVTVSAMDVIAIYEAICVLEWDHDSDC